jgi:hypothetical protein
LSRWYLNDVRAPLVVSVLITGVARVVLPATGAGFGLMLKVGAVAFLVQLGAVLVVPLVRTQLGVLRNVRLARS